METGKVANHPLGVVVFPIKRRAPLFLIDFLPASRMPPTKILIAAGIYEFAIVGVTHRSPIDQEVFKENLVLRLFVVEGEVVTEPRAVARGLRVLIKGPVATAPGSVTNSITELEQPAVYFRHAAYCFNRVRRRRNRRVELIAEQVLDVVNQQVLM